ncbi:MAG: metal ABC transporter substrate-binding protein [Firmicutes bacterium]|nr:metal ABC transporter substrate-binding protein [Bacillota bacterium]
MHRRRWVSLVMSLAAAVVLAACGGAGPGTDGTHTPGEGAGTGRERLKVVTSVYPLYFFTRTVGGDRVEVVSLVPPGAEPHGWEPRASDLKILNSARVFVYNGAGLEPWVDRVLKSLDNKELITVDTSAGLPLLTGSGEDGHESGDYDPHIWLDPVLAQEQVKRIAAALAQADPAGKDTYEANAQALIAELAALDREYQALSACPRREIVVTHAFFGYPARRYGLVQVPIVASLSPEAEPTPKQMAELVRLVRERNVRSIFVETLVSDRVGRVLAQETGAQVLVLNPIEGLTPEEEAQGKDYLALMRENLANLRKALECGE